MESPAAPNPAELPKLGFGGQEISFLSSGFHFFSKTLLGAELNQLVIATPEVRFYPGPDGLCSSH